MNKNAMLEINRHGEVLGKNGGPIGGGDEAGVLSVWYFNDWKGVGVLPPMEDEDGTALILMERLNKGE